MKNKMIAADEDQVFLLRKNMRRLRVLLGERFERDSACCGVTPAQCCALMEIGERGRSNVTELAAELNLDKSTLSRTIDGLYHIGLVSREVVADNRRRHKLELTAQGSKMVNRINRQYRDFYLRLLAAIPENKLPQVIEALALLGSAMLRLQSTPERRT